MLGLTLGTDDFRSWFGLRLTLGRELAGPTLGLGLLLSLTAGCEQPTIRETVVPRERSGLEGPQFQLPVSAGERLLIAMIDRPENTYFLRIQAAPAAIDAVRADFEQILQSLTFTGGRVAWKLPEGWTESEGGAMFRLATLRAPSGVEVFVTSLTAGQEVLANVNRWQGQLNLPSLGPADALPIERIKVGQQEVILYDATNAPVDTSGGKPVDTSGGKPVDTSGGKPVDTSGSATGASGQPANPAGPASGAGAAGAGGGANGVGSEALGDGRGDLPFQFPALAADWQPLPPSMVASARWERKNAQGELKLEVFKFPTDATFLSMLAIWVERIGAVAPTEETLGSGVSAITVAGVPGDLVVWPVAAESVPADGKRLMVARLVVGTYAWYIKLEGTATAVADFEAGFKTFLSDTTRL